MKKEAAANRVSVAVGSDEPSSRLCLVREVGTQKHFPALRLVNETTGKATPLRRKFDRAWKRNRFDELHVVSRRSCVMCVCGR